MWRTVLAVFVSAASQRRLCSFFNVSSFPRCVSTCSVERIFFGVVFSEPFLAILKSFSIRDRSRSVFTVFVFLCISRSIFPLSPVFPFPVSLGEECGLHRKELMSLLAFHKMHQLEGDTNWKDTNNFDTPGHIHRMPNLSGTPRKMRETSETGFPSCDASTGTR